MYRATTYHCEIKHFPNARRRGQTQVYIGTKDRRGKEEYENAVSMSCMWFDTYEEAKNWLISYFQSKQASALRRYEEASKDLEKAMSL